MFGLKKLGIVGINQRNLDFIAQHNSRQFFPNADSKLLTKKLAEQASVRVPKLIDVVRNQYEVKRICDTIKQHTPCVIKPDHGSGGGGITVLLDTLPIGFQKASGDVLSEAEVRFQTQDILSGKYSLGNKPDIVLIEQAVQFDPIFNDIAFRGVPDVRVIVFKGVPVMAMLRLPTKQSDGKANLHKGGLGVGIDMERGITTHAIQYNHYIKRHPETGFLLANREIPHWQEILDIAVKMQKASKLGYIGVDIVLDKQHGPMVLEINARPGISVQIANAKGLRDAMKQRELV